jgi:thiosulfate/3-mercaptopyruvate sulfurtransferase
MLRTDNTPTPPPTSRWLKSTDWLAEKLTDPAVVIVDGSYFLPTQKRDAHAEYLSGHIPGAVFFDIEAVSDHSTDLPHMLPGPTQFGEAAGKLGIGDSDAVVVYDSTGLFFRSPRVVDVSHFRRQIGLHPRRRTAQMESRGPAGRAR